MSFILDALKKSESDRQRHSGPALFEVKVAAPRAVLPPWAVAVAALLLVNLVIVSWMLLRNRAAAPVATANSPLAAAAPPAAAPPAQAPAAQASVASPPVPGSEMSTAPAAASRPAAVGSAGAAAVGISPIAGASSAASSAATPTLIAPPATRGADTPAPEDYAPAADAGPQLFGSRVRRATAEGVPLYQDAASAPGAQLPQLHLDLVVFAAHPQDRFVMINMRRLREGDSLPEGVSVDSITAEGAVLSYKGLKFLLTRD
jgi:general secretion pathway protein B